MAGNALEVLEDLAGRVSNWPVRVVQSLFVSELKYEDRMRVASFFYNNGVPVYAVINVIARCNSAYGDERFARIRRSIEDLYVYFDASAENRARYIAYDLVQGVNTNLNGEAVNLLAERSTDNRRRHENARRLGRRISVAQLQYNRERFGRLRALIRECRRHN